MTELMCLYYFSCPQNTLTFVCMNKWIISFHVVAISTNFLKGHVTLPRMGPKTARKIGSDKRKADDSVIRRVRFLEHRSCTFYT